MFEGGGSKGMAYVGVLESLQKIDIYKHIKNFVGSSAGAITASLLYLGINSETLNDILKKLDAGEWLNSGFIESV